MNVQIREFRAEDLDAMRRIWNEVVEVVVKSNAPAIRLYRKLCFVELGTVPGGFRRDDGSFDDITLFYHIL